MAREGPRVAFKKPVLKVNRQYSSNCSSCEDPDRLSYSYSCLESFKKNQHIIRELVRLRQDQDHERTSNEPMFSLSGAREQPIYQPFYNRKDSECEQISSYQVCYKENRPTPKVEKNPSLKYINIELEPDFRDIVDRNLLYKWLKYQFKCVNSLWPFSIPRNSIFSKFSNKTRSMKMEIFLSNVDEKTKCRLKSYVNNLDLNLEERSNLCNESLIEIDITPIMSDNARLQEFLAFIHSIKSNSSRAVVDDSKIDKEQIPLLHNQTVQEDCLNKKNDNNLKKNYCKNVYTVNNKRHKIKNTGSLSVECLYVSPGTGDKVESEKDIRKYRKNKEVLNTQMNKCDKGKKKYFLKVNRSKCSVKNTVESSSSYIINSNMKVDNMGNVKKPRFYSTNPLKEQTYKYANNETKHTEQDSNRNSCNRFPVYNTKLSRYYRGKHSVDHGNGNRCVQLEKKFSCKCLMHLEREDYRRYRNQCLFGKGERCNLRKYVSVMEKKSKLKVLPFENRSYIYVKDEGKESDSETVSSEEEVLVNKIKTNKHEKIETNDSNTTFSSSTTINESSYPLCLGLPNEFQTEKVKIPEKYHISSRIISKVKENYKNEVKVKSSFPNSVSKKVTQVNKTEGLKTSSQTLLFNDYRVIHIKDVEELVCEVSYSDTSCKTSSYKTNSSSKSSDISCTNIINKILDQESTNACFESLNYSINSIPGGTVSDTLKRKSSVHRNSNDSKDLNINSLVENGHPCSKKGLSLGSSLNKLKSVEFNKNTLVDRNENSKLLAGKTQNLKAECSGEKEDFLKTRREHEKNFRRKRTSHSLEVQRHSFMKSQVGREQKSIGENQQNMPEKADRASCVDDSKINSKICVLENNTRELQSKITELIEQLQLLNMKQNEPETNKQNSDRIQQISTGLIKNHQKSANRSRLVINSINDDDKLSKSILSTQKSNKKYLHFIKPQKIYNSISTIFKKSVESNYSGKVPISVNDNKNSLKRPHERNSSNKECQCQKLELESQRSRTLEVNPKCKGEYFLILSNLEKLNTELKHQNNEIQFLKEYIHKIKE